MSDGDDIGAYDLEPDPEGVWYYAVGDDRRGPADLDQLRKAVRDGTLTRDSLAWRAGMADWIPAGQIPALRKIFPIAGGPQPGQPQGPTLAYQSAPTARGGPHGHYHHPRNQTGDPYAGQAVTSLVLGILSIVTSPCCFLGLIFGVIALILGNTARTESTTMAGQATAGWICGIIGTAISGMICLLWSLGSLVGG
jgi:hypothetical protein